jgi:midasin
MPKSRAQLMVKLMENLQIYRSTSNLFSGKDSIITVRDLIKWAQRMQKCTSTTNFEVAMEGYLVLAERARNCKLHILLIINANVLENDK